MSLRGTGSGRLVNAVRSEEHGPEPQPPASAVRAEEGGTAARASVPGSVGRSILGYAVVILFLGLCGYYIYSHGHEFAFVSRASVGELILAGVCVVAAFGISAYQLGLFLGSFGVSTGFMELMALTMAMCLGNMVTPMRGGTGALAVYLKRFHSLDFHAFAIIYGGTGLLIALINSGLAAVGLVVLGATHGFVHIPLSLAVAALFVFCLYLSIFPPPIKWERSGILGLVFRTANSWHELTRNRRLMIVLTVSFLAVSFFLAAAFFFIYRALGTELSASGVIITSSLGNIANLVSLTPGALGIFDAIVVEIPRILGLDTARSLAAALMFRALSFGCALALGLPGILYLLILSRKGHVTATRMPEKHNEQ